MSGPFLRRERAGVAASGPAIGLVETTSIARGLVVADAMVKRAPVRLALARPLTPGKHAVLVTGEVADVDEAMGAGCAAAAGTLIDKLFLPQAHALLLAALGGGASALRAGESLGIVELFTVAAAIVAADAACKAAEVALVELRLADGLGGKAYFALAGTLDNVEAGVLAAAHALERGLLVATEIIAAPHDDLHGALADAKLR